MISLEVCKAFLRCVCTGLAAAEMPLQAAVDKYSCLIVTQRRNTNSENSPAPFPYFKVADFAPEWCGAVDEEETTSMMSWIGGFQNLALTAAAAGAWDYAASYMHLQHCICLAEEMHGIKDGKAMWRMAEVYDDLVRKKWETKALGGQTHFLLSE